jgi:hypothetical protein
MNFYKVLRVHSKVTQADLDRAYQHLVKESRYDNTINRKSIEIAYKILSDSTQRALYDASIAEDEKRREATAKSRRRRKQHQLSFKKLKAVALALTMIAVVFITYRFGYHLKIFSPGDEIYYSHSHQRLGTIVKEERNHNFGKVKQDAYLLRLSPEKTMWIPKTDVKAVCYSK